MLWSRLRRGSGKLAFRRQHACGAFILDFYCPAARLAVEVDGSTHFTNDALEHDAARDRWLAGQDIEVMRLPAFVIYRDLDGAADGVRLRAAERIQSPPLRSGGGGPCAAERMGEGASQAHRASCTTRS